MDQLLIAGVLFVVAHLGVSSTPLRAMLVHKLGERAFLGFYSILAVTTLAFLIITYNREPHGDFLWLPTPAMRSIPYIVMPIAFMFMLGGFMTRNPTAVGQESQIKSVGEGAGLVRITRHPFQWAVVLWAIAHILANGDVASLLFFGSLGTLSLAGSFLIDAKKSRSMGADWSAFAATTSNIPFAAIIQSRNRLVLRELALPLVAGIAVYALVIWGHGYISGVALR
jgi:uncharacterized membrane protein